MHPAPTTQPGLDAYAETAIRCAVHRLITAHGIPAEERDDLAQQLRVMVIEALATYDPGRAQVTTFIATCVERRAWNLLRARLSQRCDRQRVVRLDAPDETASLQALPDPQGEAAVAACDLQADIAIVVGRLPPRLQAICARLPTHSPFAIAQDLGLTKHAVYRDVALIREAFVAAGLAPALESIGNRSHQR